MNHREFISWFYIWFINRFSIQATNNILIFKKHFARNSRCKTPYNHAFSRWVITIKYCYNWVCFVLHRLLSALGFSGGRGGWQHNTQTKKTMYIPQKVLIYTFGVWHLNNTLKCHEVQMNCGVILRFVKVKWRFVFGDVWTLASDVFIGGVGAVGFVNSFGKALHYLHSSPYATFVMTPSEMVDSDMIFNIVK